MLFLLAPPQKPPVRIAKFASSVLAHIAVVAAAVALSQYAAAHYEEIDWSRYTVEPLRLHESVSIFFAPSPEKAVLRTAAAVAGGVGRRKAGPTVLEPDYHPQAKLPASVPPLAHWSRVAPPDMPKPKPAQVLVPGTAEEPSSRPQLTTKASLSVPNRESVAADVNISLPPAASQNRRSLAVANSSTMPIQTEDSGPARAASFDISAGQPVNVLALAENRKSQPYVEIPRGLQNLSSSGDAGSQGLGAGHRARAERRRVSQPGSSSASTGTSNDVEDAAHEADAGKSSASASGLRALAQSEVKRLEHPPNGSYDVVVTQSASLHEPSALGSSSGGGPVYTVYLPVGDEKEWLMEFCSLASPRVPQNSYHVTVADDDSIAPPFPISTVIPAKLLSALSSKLVLHGCITAAGRLRDFRLTGPASPAGEALLKLLEEWRFRPATRNRAPIDVDVLLVVPPRG